MTRLSVLVFASVLGCLSAARAAAPLAPDPVLPPALPAPGTPEGLLPALAANAWGDYKTRFISDDGRLVDDVNGHVSHSEGQGYAMLLAVAAGDSLGFSRIWGWTARELYTREDGLASWRWSPTASPHVTDRNNATDGDLLIAWALAAAAKTWRSPEYKAAARRIALAVGKAATFKSRFGLTLLPAASGFSAKDMVDGPVVNLSYWVFPAFRALADIAPEVDWAGLTASGVALIRASRFGPTDLPSDWVSIKSDPAPAKNFPSVFGYNALRIPLYLVWGGAASPELLAPFGRLMRAGARPSLVNVSSGLPTEPFFDSGYAAVFALAQCAGQGTPFPAEGREVSFDHYYSTTLHILALLAARDRGLSCG